MFATDPGWLDGQGGASSTALCACGLLALGLRLAVFSRSRSSASTLPEALRLGLSLWAVVSICALFYDTPRVSHPHFLVRALGGTALLPIMALPFAVPVPFALHMPLQLGTVVAVGASRGAEVCRAAAATPEGRAAVVEAWTVIDGVCGGVVDAMYQGLVQQGDRERFPVPDDASLSCGHLVGWALLVVAFALPTYGLWAVRGGRGPEEEERHGGLVGCGCGLMVVMGAVTWKILAGFYEQALGEGEAGMCDAGVGGGVE